jgi:lysozyme family protein
MTILEDMTRTYDDAVEALRAIDAAQATSAEQRRQVRAALDDLHDAFKDGVAAELAHRNAQLNLLVERLHAVTGSIVTDPLRVLRERLNASLEHAKALVIANATAAFASAAAPSADEAEQEAVETVRAREPAAGGTDADDAAEPPLTAAVAAPLRAAAAPSAAAAASPVPEALYKEYAALFAASMIRPDRLALVEQMCGHIAGGRGRYQAVAEATGVPWWVVGIIHAMEAGLKFDRHLHNGDPLTARTVRVPAGRPAAGEPPFAWEASAADALSLDRFVGWSDWSLPTVLYKLERYNGWGYRKHHPEVLTPYLWSCTNHYSKGKYVADGKFDAEAVSKQVGAAAILRGLVNAGTVQPGRG